MRPFPVILFLCCTLFINPSRLAYGSISSKSDWYKYYQPITQPGLIHTASRMMQNAAFILGEPVAPVKRVILRFSEPVPAFAHLKKSFQLTEITDYTQGIYTIYLNHQLPEKELGAQLAHEIAHLFNARIHDAYYEGLCTVLAEKMARDLGLEWDNWQRHFDQAHEPFYAKTYFMMKEILQEAGEENFSQFQRFTVPWALSPSSQKLAIDINQWLSTLPASKQAAIKQVILKYAAPIQTAIAQSSQPVAFLLPE